MDDIYAAGTSKCINTRQFEVNNNYMKPKSPDNSIKKYIGLDYKQLQAVVASWGLPANLKRKQLLAIIVAKQKKKDYMIPAILNEVDRERMEKKKCIKSLHERVPSNRFYYKQKHLYHYQMQYQPQQNQTTNSMASLYGRKYAPPLTQELTQKLLQEGKLVNYIENDYYKNTYPNFQFDHIRLLRHLHKVDTLSQDVQKSYTNGTLMLDFINKHPIPPEVPKMKQTTTVTTSKLFSQPTTPVLVYAMMKDLTKTIMSSKENPCNYPITYIDPPFSSLNFTFGEQQDLQDADDLIIDNLDGSNELNLDSILDYIMGAEEKDDSPQNTLENLFAVETQHDTESAWKIYEMQLRYHAQIITKHLYAVHPLYSLPYSMKRIFCDSINDYAYYCVRPTQNSPLPMFAKAMKVIPHSYEAKSNYTQKNCVYPVNRQRYNPGLPGIPERCMLHPENSLSYGVPKLYFNATQDYANSSQMMNNYLIHSNNQADTMRNAFTIPQVHYNIMLPKSKVTVPPRSVYNSGDYAELRPRNTKTNNEFDVEPTIPPLSVAEEMLAYNSLDDIGNINIRINENFKYIAQVEHDSYCIKAKLPCPFLFTQCCWYENLPLLAQHIRTMHPERIVSKKQAEYFINFIQLESIKNGVKIIQEYNNRMIHISLCSINSYIYITGQEVCENFDQHMDKMKILLLVKHQSGVRSWKGDINQMYIPLSQLWRTENALIIPVQYLKLFPTKHFKLFVQIGL